MKQQTTFIALLRAVNVGGTGKLAMADLVKICEKAGFQGAKTYIQSGNVVFKSESAEREVRSALEKALEEKLGKPVAVMVRGAEELDRVLEHNPFRDEPPNRVIIMFLDEVLPRDSLTDIKRPGGEELRLLGRELYIYYPNGQGTSKLRIPFADKGTGRNVNTVTRLAELARSIS